MEQLILAIATNDLQAVDDLLEIVDITANDNYAFIFACCSGHLGIVNKFLGIPKVVEKIACQGNLALHTAIFNDRVSVFNRLLEFPEVVRNISSDDNIVLSLAVGNETIFNRLLEFDDVVKNISAVNNRVYNLAVDKGLENIIKIVSKYSSVARQSVKATIV